MGEKFCSSYKGAGEQFEALQSKYQSPARQTQARRSISFAKYCYGSGRLLFQFLIRAPYPSQPESSLLSMLHHSHFDEAENLLPWLTEENMDSICIIHACLKPSLFFIKMFRVCCSASLNTSPDRCKTSFLSCFPCSDAWDLSLPWRPHEWPWKTRFRIKCSDQQKAAHIITPSPRYKCLSVKLGNQMWLSLPWAPARPTL